jgi:hypothetical protein
MSVIDERYAELGGANGFLGAPAGDEEYTDLQHRMRFRVFERGAIYWFLRTTPPQVYEVHGAVWERYQALGMHNSFLGVPTTDESPCPDGVGRFNHFQGGSIYWTPATLAHEVHGEIHDKWSSIGWERSFLGYPLTDESPCPDGLGRFNHFQGGSIYWTPNTHAHEVHGSINELWSSMNWERSALGYPLTDEMVCPDGRGRFNHFERGGIYSHPDTGTHEVHGSIWESWEDSGFEKGPYGYPRTSEYRTLDAVAPATPDKHLRISSFERGFIAFNEATSALTEAMGYPFDGLMGIAVPIYWGKQWDPSRPALAGQSWQDVDRALDRLLTAGLALGMRGYGIATIAKAKPTWLNEDVPPRFFDALPAGSNPQTDPTKGFSNKDLTDRITNAVVNGPAPWPADETIEPDNLPPLTSRLTCYLVILPRGCHFTDNPWGEGGHWGKFTFQAPDWVDKDVRFAWVGQEGTLNETMETVVHELLEALNDAAGLEIADRCQAGATGANPKNEGFDATIAGVTIRSYWSNFHSRCIAPPELDPVTRQAAVQ